MSDKNEEKKELKKPEREQNADRPETPQQLTPKQIFDAYPNDKEKARDYLLLGIQTDLNRIANTIEYMARRLQISAPIAGLDTSPADPPKEK